MNKSRILQFVGQASMCWDGIYNAGEFDSAEASRIADQIHSEVLDGLESAWRLIANAYDGNWSTAPKEWRESAERWRDEVFHNTLGELPVNEPITNQERDEDEAIFTDDNPTPLDVRLRGMPRPPGQEVPQMR